MAQEKEKMVSRWYFGGLGSAGAAAITHPLDLIKVQMQTQKGKKNSIVKLTMNIIKNTGVLGLYNGISASLLRQMTYSTARFGIYEVMKQNLIKANPQYKGGLPFHLSVMSAAMGGFFGGLVGSPADLVNVRMQNDSKLPVDQRRNYKNAFHGLFHVARTEGVARLWSGASLNCFRSMLMTVGQLAFYDLIKAQLLKTSFFGDNVFTHTTSSLLAGAIATSMTQPVDVLKTRLMNAKPGEYSGPVAVFAATVREGPLAFYKGFLPAFARLAPQTIFTFIFMEQLRLRFGIREKVTS